ncbi:hypothetical protein LDX54_05965 [Lactobacillus sp. IBH004]|nr:hypothetical protein [Lactobacillus sp. IBH004]UZN41315.1 hypothetical protein LDX54_05965 [Lactobacillus sp. IBH004]
MKLKKTLGILAATLILVATGLVFSSKVEAKYIGHNATPYRIKR